ncbi:CaiB/BaiF CoA transferase family protein [Microbacterium suaedae]|uniref:CaiB/BaiF CoA transferase family protein n=1 Tax=Microbacterium suaedae TaxID=2067813 RepID=UPI000DA1440F|nr:CaiB/BaiF CoA-transferase family protein [Microbacterium suaedae]
MTSSMPLEGMLVADHTIFGPGPYATELLSRLGARVVKFEPPGGDPARRIPGLWRAFNGVKESVECDLRTDEGLSLATVVASRADVFVNSWRPGVAERLGLGADALFELNPRLVHCTLTGFGSTGPLRDRPGHEINYLAASGALRGIMQDLPGHPGMPIGDTAAGMYAAFRIVSAVWDAKARGKGSEIEVAVAGVLAEFAHIGAGADGSVLAASNQAAAYGVFSTADGHRIVLGIVDEEPFWRALCEALELPHLADLSAAELFERGAELRAILEQEIGARALGEIELTFGPRRDIPWNVVEEADALEFRNGVPPARGLPSALDEHGELIRREFGSVVDRGAGVDRASCT